MVETELVAKADVPAILNRIQTITDMASAIKGADHVVEAVPENVKN